MERCIKVAGYCSGIPREQRGNATTAVDVYVEPGEGIVPGTIGICRWNCQKCPADRDKNGRPQVVFKSVMAAEDIIRSPLLINTEFDPKKS